MFVEFEVILPSDGSDMDIQIICLLRIQARSQISILFYKIQSQITHWLVLLFE